MTGTARIIRGDALVMADQRLSVDRLDVLLSRCSVTADGCWEWLGAKDVQGYGRAGYGPRKYRAGLVHRMVYEALVGEVGPGLELDHLCRNTSCANPSHLEPVTHQENVRRGESGRNLVAKAASITHCPQGHPYTTETTYVHPTRGSRSCIPCQRAATRRWRERRTG